MLTLKNYDYAVVDYLSTFVDNVIYGEPHEAFQNSALKHGDKVILPLVSVYRSDIALASTQNEPQFRRGVTLDMDSENLTSNKEFILHFKLTYTVDVWAVDPEDCEALFCELLFMMREDPGILVKHEGIERIGKNFLTITDISENTDSASLTTRGRLNRYTLVFQMPAHIARLAEHKLGRIVPKFYVQDTEKSATPITD